MNEISCHNDNDAKVSVCVYVAASCLRVKAPTAAIQALQRTLSAAVTAARQPLQASCVAGVESGEPSLCKNQKTSRVLDIDAGIAVLQAALGLDVADLDRLNAAYRKILEAYRTGQFGKFTLDSLS